MRKSCSLKRETGAGKAPPRRIRLGAANSESKVLKFFSAFKAFAAAFVLYALTVHFLSTTIVIDLIAEGNRSGPYMQDGDALPSSAMINMHGRLLENSCSVNGGNLKGSSDRWFHVEAYAWKPVLFYASCSLYSFFSYVRTIFCLIAWTMSAKHTMFTLARVLSLLRFVWPSHLHGAGLVMVFTFLAWIQFDGRVEGNPDAFAYPLVTCTISTYCVFAFLGIPAMFWGALSAVKILNAVLGFSKSTAMYLLWITSPFLLKGWVEQKRPSTPESQDSNRVLRRRLRNCTRRLLQIAWQRHKAICSMESQQQPFWKIYEAKLVLSIWNTVKLNRYASIQERRSTSYSEFLAPVMSQVESFSHPGKSSLFRVKKHQPLSDANQAPAAAESFAAAKFLVDQEDWEKSAERSELLHSCLLLVQHDESPSTPAIEDNQPPLPATTTADGTQVTIIFGKQAYVFDGISSNSLCSDLIAQLEVRLGSKIPAHAQLMGNGRFLRMHEPIEEAGLIGGCILEVALGQFGGMDAMQDAAGSNSSAAAADSFWSIPIRLLRPLLSALEKDIKAWIGSMKPVGSNGEPVEWDGKSYAFKEYFEQNRIDPKIDPRYSKYYVNQRHTIAGSYVWAANRLTDFADELEKPIHSDKYCWIDVLINRQFEIDADKVVGVTGDIYSRCDVLVLLSNTIFQRGWCLYEAANYTTKGCTIFVAGQCLFLQGEDYFASMKVTEPSDERLIKDEIAKMFGADCQAKFNRAIDDAVVTVYGESLLYNGLFQEAVPVFEKELGMKERRGDDEGSIASTYIQLGRTSYALGEYTEALSYYDEALQRYARFHGDNHVYVAKTHVNIGEVFRNMGKFEKAMFHYNTALPVLISQLGSGHADVASTKDNIGIVLMKQGKLNEALKYHEEALRIRQNCFGNMHADVASTKDNIGIVLMNQGKLNEALKYHEEALRIRQSCFGNMHVDVAKTHVNMGIVYRQQGNNEKALFHYNTALPILISQLGSGHVDVAKTEDNIGIVLMKKGDYENALLHSQKALKIFEQALGPHHVSVATTKKNIGVVYQNKGDQLTAKDYFKEAYNIFLRALGPDHPETRVLARFG